MERITIRLRDPADIRWWKRFIKGKTKNAAGIELVRAARQRQEQMDRMERKLDDILNMSFTSSQPQLDVDEVETNLDDQLSSWV